MSISKEKFSFFVGLDDIEYTRDIDFDLVGCYVYHMGELIDVLVLSDEDQRLKIKNISPKDKLRFECKLLGSHQKFLGSVSISAGQLLALPPGQSWSQQLPLFGEGEPDESHAAFGDAEVGPPCVLLAFEPVGGVLPGASASNRASRASEARSRPSGVKAGQRASGAKKGRAKGAVTGNLCGPL